MAIFGRSFDLYFPKDLNITDNDFVNMIMRHISYKNLSELFPKKLYKINIFVVQPENSNSKVNIITISCTYNYHNNLESTTKFAVNADPNFGPAIRSSNHQLHVNFIASVHNIVLWAVACNQYWCIADKIWPAGQAFVPEVAAWQRLRIFKFQSYLVQYDQFKYNIIVLIYMLYINCRGLVCSKF
jgi:hypothetical protein